MIHMQLQESTGAAAYRAQSASTASAGVLITTGAERQRGPALRHAASLKGHRRCSCSGARALVGGRAARDGARAAAEEVRHAARQAQAGPQEPRDSQYMAGGSHPGFSAATPQRLRTHANFLGAGGFCTLEGHLWQVRCVRRDAGPGMQPSAARHSPRCTERRLQACMRATKAEELLAAQASAKQGSEPRAKAACMHACGHARDHAQGHQTISTSR